MRDLGEDIFTGRLSKPSPEVEQILMRIKDHDGVQGVIVVNYEDIPIRSTLDNPSTQLYVQSCRHLLALARHTVRDLDPTNDLTILRVRSNKNEILIAPEHGYLLIVVQAISPLPYLD